MLMQHTRKLLCKFVIVSVRLLLHGVPPRLTQGDWHIQKYTTTFEKNVTVDSRPGLGFSHLACGHDRANRDRRTTLPTSVVLNLNLNRSQQLSAGDRSIRDSAKILDIPPCGQYRLRQSPTAH